MIGKVADAVRGTGFEGTVFLVGGAVRDEILGRDVPPDLDLVVEGDAMALAELLRDVGVSEIDPVLYPRFGTAMVMIDSVQVELVTARSERYDVTSRKPKVEPATILEDAKRRDFTCNTLMRRVESGELVDSLGCGLADLEAGVLRTPLDAEETFSEDPLRMLRAVRFKWKLGFEFAPGTEEAIRATAGRLSIISAERIREELVKMLVLPNAHHAVEELRVLGLLREFWPELEEAVGVPQGPRHPTVWEHVLGVVEKSVPRLDVRLGALLHDVAKLRCRSVEGTRTWFRNHEVVGEEMAVEMMRRLKFSEDEVREVRVLVRNHMRFGSKGVFSKRAVRRLIRELGDRVDSLLDLAWADREAYRTGAGARIEAIRRTVEEIRVETSAKELTSPLSGEEIMALTGLKPGPGVGVVKQRLENAVIDGRLGVADKDGAEALVKSRFRNWLRIESVGSDSLEQ